MDVNKPLRVFFIMLGIGFVFSSMKVNVCNVSLWDKFNMLYETIFFNFVVGLYVAIPWMLGTLLYQYLNKNKK